MKWFMRLIISVAIVGGLAYLVLLPFAPPLDVLFRVVFWEGWSPQVTVKGRVVDSATGSGLDGAKVWVQSSGLGIGTRVDSTTSLADGRYTLKHRGRQLRLLYTTRPGFAPYRVKGPVGETHDIALGALPRDQGDVICGSIILELGSQARRSAWSFSNARWSKAPDITLAWQLGPDTTISIRALGEGGVSFVPGGRSTRDGDLAAITCEAPAEGYRREVRLSMDDPDGICFVRTRDGAHYAKVELRPGDLLRLAQSPYRSNAKYRSWYNAAGGRGMCSGNSDCIE